MYMWLNGWILWFNEEEGTCIIVFAKAETWMYMYIRKLYTEVKTWLNTLNLALTNQIFFCCDL